jgi:photosynthetic reaction center cytochrome c subunit
MTPRSFFLATALGLTLVGTLVYQQTHAVQRGYRGTGMALMYKPDALARQDVINKFPKPLRAARAGGPLASEAYQNVQVLGDLTQGQMVRLMLSIKDWVAPQVGCNYCHAAPDYASDAKYTKRVAREMLRMTRHINADWAQHVQANGPTGVTCYTCHRGQPVPAKTWFTAPTPAQREAGFMRLKSSVKPPTLAAANTVLSVDAMSKYLLGTDNIRFQGTQALPVGHRYEMQKARDTYSLMMVMSESLGVNCNFCHTTRAFASWPQSSPQRATAWHGIRMVRDLNNQYVAPLNALLPPERLGPTGDAPKVYCATCHQGSYRPFNGAPMLAFYPELIGKPQATPGAVSATAATLEAPGAAGGTAPLVASPAAAQAVALH